MNTAPLSAETEDLKEQIQDWRQAKALGVCRGSSYPGNHAVLAYLFPPIRFTFTSFLIPLSGGPLRFDAGPWVRQLTG